jgi:hypothetical protein
MFIIDIALKHAPSLMSVQRKSLEDAKAVYAQVADALRSGSTAVLELTCEQQPEKIITILVSEIAAVQMAEKSTMGTSGRAPGFFALTE